MIIYDKTDNIIYLVIDSFMDSDIGLGFLVVESENELDGIMDLTYLDANCEIIGWL